MEIDENERIPNRKKGHGWQTYEERFPRYAHNASLTAEHAQRSMSGWARTATYSEAGAENCARNGDDEGAKLYHEMALAAQDAYEALRDVNADAKALVAYFEKRSTDGRHDRPAELGDQVPAD